MSKTFLAVALSAVTAFGQSSTINLPEPIQTPPPPSHHVINGVAGLTWGMSREECEKVVTSKGAKMTHKELHSMFFEGGTFAERSVDGWSLRFVKGQLYEVVFLYVPDMEAKVIPLYDTIKDLVKSKYGAGEETKQNWSQLDLASSIGIGKATLSTDWNGKADNYDPVNVRLTVRNMKHRLMVLLFYTNEFMARKAEDAEKERAKGDL